MTGLNGTSEETRMLEPSMQPTLKALDNEVEGLRRLDHDSADLIVFPLRAHSYFARLKERQGSYQCLALAYFLHILKPCFGKHLRQPPQKNCRGCSHNHQTATPATRRCAGVRFEPPPNRRYATVRRSAA